MKSNNENVGPVFIYTMTLSLIAIVASVVGMVLAGKSDVGITTFVGFLPVAFFMVEASNRQLRMHIETLESRLRQLETTEGNGNG